MISNNPKSDILPQSESSISSGSPNAVNKLPRPDRHSLKIVRQNISADWTVGYTFGELQKLVLPSRNEIISGLARGEVGLLNAVNNVGKTTLIRNLAIKLTIGEDFRPLINGPVIRKVAILDFEDGLANTFQDLNSMACVLTYDQRRWLEQNLLIICDVRDESDEDFSLSNEGHWKAIRDRLRDFGPDLIIVDTISSAFGIQNENDNAEVRRVVMRPLRRLAKDSAAAVLAIHHVGKSKSEDGQTREQSHKGRGASSFADHSRIVINLNRDSTEKNCVVLEYAKIKGPIVNDTLLRYEPRTRWFTEINTVDVLSKAEIIIRFFEDGEEHRTAEVVEHLASQMSKQYVSLVLRTLVKRNTLVRTKHGVYRKS